MVALFRLSLSNFLSYHWVHSHFYTKPSLVYIAEAPTNIRLRYRSMHMSGSPSCTFQFSLRKSLGNPRATERTLLPSYHQPHVPIVGIALPAPRRQSYYGRPHLLGAALGCPQDCLPRPKTIVNVEILRSNCVQDPPTPSIGLPWPLTGL